MTRMCNYGETIDADTTGAQNPRTAKKKRKRNQTLNRYQSFSWCVVANSSPPAVARFAEPLAMTSVYPYLPEMIKSFGIPENNVARWAGLVGSTFSISQSLFAVPWGRLSDKIGRKPSILIGLTTTMVLFIVWGTASSLAMALVVRTIMGAGNGNGTSTCLRSCSVDGQ